jgi:hypothetical protein
VPLFSKNSKWRIIQNGEFIYQIFDTGFLWWKNETIVAKHEISKWKFKFKMDIKHFYWLKLVNLISILKFFKIVKIWLILHLLQQKKKFIKSQNDLKIYIWQIFCTIIHDFLVAEPLYAILLTLFYCKKHCCQSWKFKMAAVFKMASKMFIFFTQYF